MIQADTTSQADHEQFMRHVIQRAKETAEAGAGGVFAGRRRPAALP